MLSITYFYRKLFCRKGYGVHSPFVFDLITNVIEEKSFYYSYHDISLIREQLIQKKCLICYNGKQINLKKALRKYGISKKEGEFLFRLTNHYKPRTILSIGSSGGLTPLYLSRYDSNVECVTLESEPDLFDLAVYFLERETNTSHIIWPCSYHDFIPEKISIPEQIDCIYTGKDVGTNALHYVFAQCFPYIHDKTFWALAGIHSSPERLQFWKEICQHPNVTVAVDLYQMGLLFFDPKLHKRVYKTIIP